MLSPFPANDWNAIFSDAHKTQAIQELERGKILFFPRLSFNLLTSEAPFLCPTFADPKAKNIGYHPEKNTLWGVQRLTDEEHLHLKAMLDRFSRQALQLVKHLFPSYDHALTVGRTSFRPMQICGRKTSYRKDDKRLHIDAFPSAPNQGKRILRVFSNINPNQEDRIWRVGEPFEKMANHFLPRINQPFPGTSAALRFLRITKSYRTLYDHYMLRLHDSMKADETYQESTPQQEIRFPAGSSWIVQTDHVSHAAMQGQYVLEQTFYLPVSAMKNEEHAPLRILERLIGKELVK